MFIRGSSYFRNKKGGGWVLVGNEHHTGEAEIKVAIRERKEEEEEK